MLSFPLQVQKTDVLAGHKDCLYALAPAHKPQEIYAADATGVVALWDLAMPDLGKMIAQVDNSVYALHFWREAKILIIGHNFEGLHFIDTQNHKEIHSIKITNAAIFDIQVWQKYAWVACGDGVVIIIDIERMAIKKYIKASEKSARCLTISPEKQCIAIGYSDSAIRIFDLDTFEPIQQIKAHSNSVFTLQYAPQSQFLLSGSRDAHLKVWNANENYALKQDIVAHLYAINHIAFSPDTHNFATCSMDKSIKIWDSQTYKLLKVIDKARHAGHATSVNKLLWTSYENKLLSASDDTLISVWQLH